MKSIRKIFSVKTRIVCDAEVYLEPSHTITMELFLQKKLTAFSRQKQPPEMFYKKICSKKLYKIHRKTSVTQSLF